VDLGSYNAAARDTAVAALRPCADIAGWLAAVTDARPYATVVELLERAAEESEHWQIDDVDAALGMHPRIGESAAGASTEARLSRREQPPADPATAAAITAGNAEYERRFGRIFLVRAAGRTAQDILAALTARLRHSPDVEDKIVVDQFREIALLRLEGLITP